MIGSPFGNETTPAKLKTRPETGVFLNPPPTTTLAGHPHHQLYLHPKAPSRQLLATWAVEAWKKVPEELVRKSWIVCQYKTTEEIANENTSSTAVVEYDEERLRQIVEQIAGANALTLYDDPENTAEDEFPEDVIK